MGSVRRRRVNRPLSLALYLGLCGVGGSVLALHNANADDPPPASQVVADAATVGVPGKQTLAPVVKKVRPAVVSIRSFGASQLPNFMDGGTPRGVGSGFIVESKGIVVTNHHVVASAGKLEVRLSDGRRFEAKVLGSDPESDIAVLELQDVGKANLPTVKFGSSDKMDVGDFVIAMGSPMGLEHTVTTGIVSAKGRGSLGLYQNSYIDFLQTDATIAPGSSGGPLLNLKGEVIAVNTAVNAGTSGLGFAVPSEQAKSVIPQLRDKGKVSRGWLGISGRDIEPALGGAAPVPGAVIAEVYTGTPAADGGLLSGDRVLSIDGTKVEDFTDLRSRISAMKPEAKVAMIVERDGKKKTLKVVLGEVPNKDSIARLGPALQSPKAPKFKPKAPKFQPKPTPKNPGSSGNGLFNGSTPRLGVSVVESSDGLQVQGVTQGSLAEQLGLKEGDVLTQVNGRKTTAVADVAEALGKDDKRVSVTVQRGSGTYSSTVSRW